MVGEIAEIASWALLTQCRRLHCALATEAEQSWLLNTGETVKFSKWFKSCRRLLEAVDYSK